MVWPPLQHLYHHAGWIMHVQGEELWTFNRILLACFQLRGGRRSVRLFMRYFTDRDLLRLCFVGGGNHLRHQLRIPKHAMWEAHHRRRRRGAACFTNLQLKQICSRARTPNEHFWAKSHYPGGTEAVEELAEHVRNLRAAHGYRCRRRVLKEKAPYQYVVAKALVEVVQKKCRGRRNKKTAEGLVEVLVDFALAHPENCRKIPTSLAKLRKRVESALLHWRRPTQGRRFHIGGDTYRLRWAEKKRAAKGRGRQPFVYWLELE